MKKTIRLIILTLAALALISCDGSVINKYFGVAVESIKFKEDTYIAYLDNPVTLTITTDPADAATTSFTWTSSDENVATVGSNGKVTGISNGKATITATAKNDSNKTATCEVRVCGYSDCITFSSNDAFDLGVNSFGIPANGHLYGVGTKSEVITDWTEFTSGTTVVSAQPDSNGIYHVYLRGKDMNSLYCTQLNITSTEPNIKVDCSGNIMSLLDYEKPDAVQMSTVAFIMLFFNCTALNSAQYLVLPAESLSYCCYQQMFANCTSLTKAPVTLPATRLVDSCYDLMFSGCTKLETAPKLNAETLATNCCYKMFEGCSKLRITTNANQTGAIKIFTCPDTTGLYTPVTDMFASTGGDTDDPVAGTTYYYY